MHWVFKTKDPAYQRPKQRKRNTYERKPGLSLVFDAVSGTRTHWKIHWSSRPKISENSAWVQKLRSMCEHDRNYKSRWAHIYTSSDELKLRPGWTQIHWVQHERIRNSESVGNWIKHLSTVLLDVGEVKASRDASHDSRVLKAARSKLPETYGYGWSHSTRQNDKQGDLEVEEDKSGRTSEAILDGITTRAETSDSSGGGGVLRRVRVELS